MRFLQQFGFRMARKFYVFDGAPDARNLGIWLLAHSLVYLLIPVVMAIAYFVFRGQMLFPMWPAILAGIGTAWVIAKFQRDGLPLWSHDQRGAKLTTHREAMAKQRKLLKKGDPGIYWGDVLGATRAS